MSEYQNNPPTSRKQRNSSGMITNARPMEESPNGMAFEKPEVEQYFTLMQQRHWDDEDGYEARQEAVAESMGEGGDPNLWVREHELCERVSDARFLHRPVAGNPKPKVG